MPLTTAATTMAAGRTRTPDCGNGPDSPVPGDRRPRTQMAVSASSSMRRMSNSSALMPGAHRRIVDPAEPVDQPDPLPRPKDGVDVPDLPVAGSPADVDVVGVVAHGERVVRPGERHRRDDLVRLHHALERQKAADGEIGDRADALVAADREAVDGGDVDGAAAHVLGDVP